MPAASSPSWPLFHLPTENNSTPAATEPQAKDDPPNTINFSKEEISEIDTEASSQQYISQYCANITPNISTNEPYFGVVFQYVP
jgi:hypothetical protein